MKKKKTVTTKTKTVLIQAFVVRGKMRRSSNNKEEEEEKKKSTYIHWEWEAKIHGQVGFLFFFFSSLLHLYTRLLASFRVFLFRLAVGQGGSGNRDDFCGRHFLLLLRTLARHETAVADVHQDGRRRG